MKKENKIKELTLVALFMALVVIGSRIYIGTHDTFRFHLGNSMCLLAAFILTPVEAGIAAGVGSMIFDMLFYPSGLACIITLVTKFAMSYFAGLCFNILMDDKKNRSTNNELNGDNSTNTETNVFKVNNQLVVTLKVVLSGAFGEIIYIILYALKTFIERRYVLSMAMEAVIPILCTKVAVSLVNAVVAIIISTLLYKIISKIKI